MRIHKQGANYRVTLSEQDVASFARKWPCFGDVRAFGFILESNGDLVDIWNDRGMDEIGVSAMIDEARAEIERRHKAA